jgi:hypothetical protein
MEANNKYSRNEIPIKAKAENLVMEGNKEVAKNINIWE